MNLKKAFLEIIKESQIPRVSKEILDKWSSQINNRKRLTKDQLPDKLYHVTTNYSAVVASGYLKAGSGLDSGGLGGTESYGVSFTTSKIVADAIENELKLLSMSNNANNERDFEEILKYMDVDRAEVVRDEVNRVMGTYKDLNKSILHSLNLTRNMFKFRDKPFYDLVIFSQSNITMPIDNIKTIEISKDNIFDDSIVLVGVDDNEIRVLDNVKI